MLGTSPTQRGLKLPTKLVSALAAFALVFSFSAPTFALSDDDAPAQPADSQVGETGSEDAAAPAPVDESEANPAEFEPEPAPEDPALDEPVGETPVVDESAASPLDPGTESEDAAANEPAADEPTAGEPAGQPSPQLIDPLGSLLAVTADEPEVEWSPEVSVFLADGTTAYSGQALEAGAELVVKGSGFDPEGNVGGRGVPIPDDLPQGTYVVFGSFADNWRPSAGAPSANRALNSASQGWVLAESVLDQVPPKFQGSVRSQWVELDDSGEFAATITLQTPAAPLSDGNWGIYTYAAGGVNNADQETYTPVNYFAPQVEVFLADGTTPYTGQQVFEGDELIVKGAGFNPEGNLGGRGVPIPAHLSQGTYVVFSTFADEWRPSAGAPSSNRVSNGNSQGWVLPASVVDQVPAPFKPAVERQWVELSAAGEFTATLTLIGPAAPLEDGNWGVYTYAAGGSAPNAGQETYTPVNYAQQRAELEVFLADGETPYDGRAVYTGDKLVVKGKNYLAEDNIGGTQPPIPEGLSRGNYVVFGNFADSWQPSAGAPTGSRANIFQRWVLPESVVEKVPSNFQDAVRRQWVELQDDDTFSFEFTVPAPGERSLLDRNWGVYSYAAGGVINAKYELSVPINFLGERDTFTPEIAVYLADGKTRYVGQELVPGDKLVVKGAGFDPAANVGGSGVPIPADLPQGTFVVFGNFAAEWQPSAEAPTSARQMDNGSRKWVLPESVLEQVPSSDVPSENLQGIIRADWAELSQDGTFNTTIDLVAPNTVLEDGNWGIYTYAAGVGTSPNAAQELSHLLNFNRGETGGNPGEVDDPEVGAGALLWGVSASFRSYLGTMSDARITTGQGAVQNTSGIFEFGQTTGATYNTKTGKGNVPYGGWVNFNAHGGVLDVTITDPAIEVLSSTSAKLTVEHSGSRVHLANLDLSVATKSTKDGVVTYKNVKVTITDEGTQKVMSGFPFSETDYLTFSVGSAAESPVDPDDSVKPGKPGSPGNNGGSKPVVDVPTEVPQTEQEQEEREERYACYADSAALKWGFSDRFRAYVSGIAYGDWSASGGATYSTPQFAWSNGSGSLDSQSAAGVVGFTGSVNFTGHSGVLNTTVANPAVEISGSNAYLLMDVVGVTQMGKTVTAKQIRFATLNLSRAHSTVSGHTTTFSAVPVVLTQAGSDAFGTYPAGFGMDPLTFTYTLNPDCGDVSAIAGKLGDADAAAATDGEIELDEDMIADALGNSDDSANDTEDDAANNQHDDAPVAAVTPPAGGANSGGGLPLAVWIVLAVLVLAGGAGGIVLALRPKKAAV